MTMTLKAARVNTGMTIEEAAPKSGVSIYTLMNYENGKTYPSVPELKRIEEVYGIEYKDIFFSLENTVKSDISGTPA